jgi:transcriptional regulator
VLALEDATLLGAVVEVLGLNYLIALLGFQAVLVTAENDVNIVEKKAEEIVEKAEETM